MINHGKQKSTVRPDPLEITETRVFQADNITPVTEPSRDGQEGFTGFEFDLMEYTKDEYIRLQADQNAALSTEVTNTQMALCEVYEMMM